MKNSNLPTTTLYEDAKKRLPELKKIEFKLEKRLLNYPTGKIHVVSKGKNVAYYIRMEAVDKTGKYVHKSEMKTIKLYLQKKYDLAALPLVKAEISSLEYLINKADSITEKIRRLYSNNPTEVKTLIEPIDISDSDYIDEWLAEEYERKEIKEGTPTFLTDNGDYVRSKSEANIANILFKHNIPYKYECPLKLSNGRIIYPDFTILDIRTRRVKYWEHRGMMDNAEYVCHSVKRIRDYELCNIKLGEQLIITEETSTMPLCPQDIEDVVKHHLE